MNTVIVFNVIVAIFVFAVRCLVVCFFVVHKGRRTCQSLESPEHGFIHRQQFWKGEHVSFSCRPGYWLEGSLERRCLKNGTWTGDQPRCILLGKV